MTEHRFDADLTSDDKLWALLSWLFWPVAVVVLLMEDKKNQPFIKYNAVLSLAVWLVGSVIFCLYPIALIAAIYYGVMAFQGNWVEVPWLSDFIRKQGWA
ncbi:MAG: hypothetical protein ACK2TS_00815 [Anaerolineales bacterium]